MFCAAVGPSAARADDSGAIRVRPCGSIDTGALARALRLELPDDAPRLVVELRPCDEFPSWIVVTTGKGERFELSAPAREPFDYRFAALSIAELVERRTGPAQSGGSRSGPQSHSTAQDADRDSPAEDAGQTEWEDPRPVATRKSRARWYPEYVLLGRTAERPLTRVGASLVGLADFQGSGGALGRVFFAHRFERPLTLRFEADPVGFASDSGERFRTFAARMAVGLDLRLFGLFGTVGVTRLGDRSQGKWAPTAAAEMRIGLADSFALILAGGVAVPPGQGVLVDELELGVQMRFVPRVGAFADVRLALARDVLSGRLGVRVWLSGQGNADSTALIGAVGGATLGRARRCEDEGCPGSEPGSLSVEGPTLEVGLEHRF
jgi:hypothetical protein